MSRVHGRILRIAFQVCVTINKMWTEEAGICCLPLLVPHSSYEYQVLELIPTDSKMDSPLYTVTTV